MFVVAWGRVFLGFSRVFDHVFLEVFSQVYYEVCLVCLFFCAKKMQGGKDRRAEARSRTTDPHI